jgi:Holliday junction resolvasome RuvABC endonuclease subunit
MPTETVIGVDPSLTCTAVRGDLSRLIRTKPADFEHKLERLHFVGQRFAEVLPDSPGWAYVEGYGFNTQQAHSLGELGYAIKQVLYLRGWTIVLVPPATLKKFTTGKGNVEKDGVRMHVLKRWGYESSDNNDADAYALRRFGEAHQLFLAGEDDGCNKAERECFAKVEILKAKG